MTSSSPDHNISEDSAMLYSVEDHVATITFNRPEQQNTISGAMLHRFSELLLEADHDVDVRAIIVTGTGKFFCAGLDLRGSDITNNLADKKTSKPYNIRFAQHTTYCVTQH